METIDDVLQAAVLARDAPGAAPLAINLRHAVSGFGFRHTVKDHPFVAFFEDPHSLERYFNLFQPTNWREAWQISSEQVDPKKTVATLGPREEGRFLTSPWLKDHDSWDLCGPATPREVSGHRIRLARAHRRILEGGWNPKAFYDEIQGHFLITDTEFVFCVRHGRHRLAALAALGASRVPVVFKPEYPRAVSLDWLKGRDRRVAESHFSPAAQRRRRALISKCVDAQSHRPRAEGNADRRSWKTQDL